DVTGLVVLGVGADGIQKEHLVVEFDGEAVRRTAGGGGIFLGDGSLDHFRDVSVHHFGGGDGIDGRFAEGNDVVIGNRSAGRGCELLLKLLDLRRLGQPLGGGG